MIKIFIFFSLVFSSISVRAQSVRAQFKARSFNELIAPHLMYTQFCEECIEKLQSLADFIEQSEQFINKEQDPKTWTYYAICYNSIIEEANSISSNGTNRNTRQKIASLTTQSQTVLNKIKGAYEKRNRLANDQYMRLKSVDGLKCDRFYSDISLDEFLDGNTPQINYYYPQPYDVK